MNCLRQFTEMVAKEGCRKRQTAPYPCDELPGYSEALWCSPCKARKLLKELNAGEAEGFTEEEKSIIYTLLDREWHWDQSDPEKPSLITPEIREHLDKIQVTMEKVAKLL